MNVEQLRRTLEGMPTALVRFQLPTGDLIPVHFHVTEVGRVDKRFIDCGGTIRQTSTCLIQTWTADDRDHRLDAGKLAKILHLAEPILGTNDLPVEVEYGTEAAAQYHAIDVLVGLDQLTFHLAGKQTDCLAKDQCGVATCGPESGCC